MNADTQLFQMINDFAKPTPWLHPIMVAYAAGLVVGAMVTLLGFWLVRRLLVWLVEFAERTPLRPVLTTAPRPAEPVAG